MKPLGYKAYGSIGHLPNSRMGPADHCIPQGQADICTKKVRDRHDIVIVHEKLDGSCTAVARLGNEIVALGRAGWLAQSSPYEQHQLFAYWVRSNEDRFREVLKDGERLVGEWLAQAHGTKYELGDREPWAVFDLMRGKERATHIEFDCRLKDIFARPHLLHFGEALSVEAAMELHEQNKWPCEETEGVVYRVERRGKVDFLGKWVKPTKVDGKYIPGLNGNDGIEVWNWRPAKQKLEPATGQE